VEKQEITVFDTSVWHIAEAIALVDAKQREADERRFGVALPLQGMEDGTDDRPE
jgi:hypothetical protein